MPSYLSDIFSCMNDLSVSVQVKNINMLKYCEKLNAFKEKLHLWCRRVKRGNLSNFPSLEEMTDDDESLIPSVCESGFSAVLSINAKSHNRLCAQEDMQIAISNKVPRF